MKTVRYFISPKWVVFTSILLIFTTINIFSSSNLLTKRGPLTQIDFPNTDAGAKRLVATFIELSAPERTRLTKRLQPSKQDYHLVFKGSDLANKAYSNYQKLWNRRLPGIGPRSAAQSAILIFKVNTNDIINNNVSVTFNLPGGYRNFKDKLNPGLTMYRWKYTNPGSRIGMAYDGLYFARGHWFWIPKPWRFVK